MIIDETGTLLMPGAFGKDCMGNGEYVDSRGAPIECCCDECDYFVCCMDQNWEKRCKTCRDESCPRFEKWTI